MTRGELQSAQQGRALVPVVGRVEAERQVLTPVQGAWGDERLAPRVEELLVPDPRGRGRAAGQDMPRIEAKNILFVDFGAFELERGRHAAPGSAVPPGFGDGADGNPRI